MIISITVSGAAPSAALILGDSLFIESINFAIITRRTCGLGVSRTVNQLPSTPNSSSPQRLITNCTDEALIDSSETTRHTILSCWQLFC